MTTITQLYEWPAAGRPARGAFGAVVIATQRFGRGRGRAVAIKIESRAASIQLLRHETQTLLYLSQCAGVPVLLNYGSDNISRYLVMEQLFPARGALHAREIARAVGDTLREVHSLGILHNDVKPDNIMIRRRGGGAAEPVLTDWGLASLITSPPREPIGTPRYMSPAVAAGDTPSPRDDMISLFFTFWELEYGAPPSHKEEFLEQHEMDFIELLAP